MGDAEQILNFDDRLKIFNDLLPSKSDSVPKRRTFTKIPSGLDSDATGYTCDLCSKHFTREIQYFGHLQTHSGDRNWQCEKCTVRPVFNTESQLRWHEEKYHFQRRVYKCTVSGCDRSYNRPSRLEYHNRRVHLHERNFDCKICDKRFFNVHDLKAHLNTHLGTNKKVCEQCGQSFHHVSNFLRHLRKHNGIKPYQCEKCDKRFSEITILRKHMLHHNHSPHPVNELGRLNDRQFYCFVCGKTFQYVQDVRQHEITHESDKSLQCKSCSNMFSTLQEMKVHNCSFMASKNLDTPDADELNNDENSSFNLTRDWTQIMNGLLSQLDIELDNNNQNLLPYYELTTNSNHDNYFNAQTNQDSQHDSKSPIKSEDAATTSGKNDFEQLHFLKQNVCKICGAVFAHNSSMYRHLRNHSSNIVNCDFCGKQLTANSLQTHIRRVHKQEKKFTCPNCNKEFFKQADLVVHKRSHTNERPFKCTVCSKAFISSSHQVRHEKTHQTKSL